MPDNLTSEQRKYCMSQVKNKDTELEITIRSSLHKLGFRFRKHVKELPGTPDLVFSKAKLAVFIDGDFWHGYRFPVWKDKISEFWQKKINLNRERDQKNFKKLRNLGWKVLRLWKHQIKKAPDRCIHKILMSLNKTSSEN